MNIALLNQYNLQFLKTKDVLGNFEPGAMGGGIAEFLDDYTNSAKVQEGIQKVDVYLNGGLDPEGDNSLSTQVYTIRIDNSTADVYLAVGENTHQSLQTLPLQDLRNILVMWRDFLIQNGY